MTEWLFNRSNVNWSPELLNTSVTYHDCYTNVYLGFTSDLRNLSGCPQYVLELTNTSNQVIPVHIMLSRHYTDYEDMLGSDQTKIVMSLQVYQTDGVKYMVKEKDAIKPIRPDAAFTNIQYDLCRILLPPGHTTYTIVVMAYKEKPRNRKPFDFSLQVRYPSVVTGSMKPITEFPQYHFSSRAAGVWKADNGGKPSLETFKANPRYIVHITRSTFINARLETIKNREIAIHLSLFRLEDVKAEQFNRRHVLAEAEGFMLGACVLETELQAGDYVLIASEYP